MTTMYKPWRDHRLASNGKLVSENFQEWMGRSRVSQRVYHASTSIFDAFDTTKGDLGAHFGNLAQMSYLQSRLGMSDAPMHVMPVWLRISNPLRLKDTGSFHADGVALQLERKGLLAKGEGKAIEQLCDKDWRSRRIHDPQLKAVIQKAGFDGVVYSNVHEGSGDSWIALDARQVKSAIGNTGLYLLDGGSLTDFQADLELRLSIQAKAKVHSASKTIQGGLGVTQRRSA